MLEISLRTTAIGMRVHSSCRTRSRSLTLLTSFLSLTLLPRLSQRCSIGEISGDLAGQSNTFTLFVWRKFIVCRATCHRALSCWKIVACPWRRNGSNAGWTISLQYRMAFKFPWTVTKSVLARCEIPPQTITLPPPKRSCWMTLAGSIRSPSRLQTRNLPSANFKLKRDSSVKTTWFHCCLVQRWCALVQFSLIRLWSGVKGTPTYGRRPRNRAARSLFLTVLGHIRVPVAFLTNPAIRVLLRKRLRRDDVTIKLSSRRVVLRGLPGRGLSLMVPVWRHFVLSLDMALSLTWKCWATSLTIIPPVSMPIAILRWSKGSPGRRPIFKFYWFYDGLCVYCCEPIDLCEFRRYWLHVQVGARAWHELGKMTPKSRGSEKSVKQM